MMDESNATHEKNFQNLSLLIANKFHNTFTTIPIVCKANGLRFLSIWRLPTAESASVNGHGIMGTYIPLFYAIATLDHHNNNKLSLKLVTFHGKIVDQINEADHPLMTDEDKVNFVGKLEKLKLCHGIKMPDSDLKLDARTFSSMYLVERLQNDVIVR